MNPTLAKTLIGAAVGAAQASGVVPGAAFKLVARTLTRLATQPKAFEFVGRAMHTAERNGFNGSTVKPWPNLQPSEQQLWLKRAESSMHALHALSEHAARAAIDAVTDPEKLAELLSSLIQNRRAGK